MDRRMGRRGVIKLGAGLSDESIMLPRWMGRLTSRGRGIPREAGQQPALMLTRRRFTRVVMAGAALLGADGWASGASAAPADADRWYYGQARLNRTASSYQTEFRANFMTPGFSSADHPGHISAQMWVLMDNNSWVEVGIANAIPLWPDNKQGPNPVPAYSFFWADAPPGKKDWITWTGPKRNLGDPGLTNIHTVANIVPDRRDHIFRITYLGSNQGRHEWGVYIDNQLVGVSTVTKSNRPRQLQWGLELGNVSNECAYGARADGFAMAAWTQAKPGAQWARVASPTDLRQDPSFVSRWVNDATGPHLHVSKARCG